MDKYEFNIKVEQIKKLAAKKSYKEAAEIAKSMNWQKVKDWSTLATVINVQEAVGDYLEARDMAILAYNRNLGGRKLVYKLTELLIKLQDFTTANELYEEYEKISQHDVNKYILYYDLRRAEKASDNELVEILEDYKEHEIDEKYMYELAGLYSKTGRRDECIKTCDDIVLWFQDGTYVEKAIRLKQDFGVTLTNTQKKILEAAVNRKEDLEVTRELEFSQVQELVRIQQDDVEDAFLEEEKEVPDADDAKEEGKQPEIFQTTELGKQDNQLQEDDEIDLVDTDDTDETEVPELVKVPGFSNVEVKKPQIDLTPSVEGAAKAADGIDKAAFSLKELIENAKKKIENSYDQFNRESEEEHLDEKQPEEQPTEEVTEHQETTASVDKPADADIEVRVPNFNIYDTQNVQAAIAENLSWMLKEDKEENEALRPQPAGEVEAEHTLEAEDDQIEGQLSLTDWIETVREKKYGNRNTREYSKAELERLLDEKDEKSAAYEKLMAEQKALAQAQGAEFNEAEARVKAQTQMMLHAAKTDLAIRTGKATAKLEEAVARLTEAAKEAEFLAEEAQTVQEQSGAEALEAEYTATTEPISLETSNVPPITDEILASVRELMAEERIGNEEGIDSAYEVESVDTLESQEAVAEGTIDNIAAKQVTLNDENNKDGDEKVMSDEEEDVIIDELAEGSKSRKIKMPKQKHKQESEPQETVDDVEESDIDEEKKLTGDLAKLFRKYREMPGIESQLVDYFNSIEEEMKMSSSNLGNIIISGNSSSDKTDLARNLVRAINYLYPENPKKIAKTTGDSINHRGISKAMNKLKGTALLVEGAGSIQPKRINEIMNCLEQDTERMIVIFEDSDAEINVLLKFNPELTNKFNHRIVLKQYTVNELVEMARKFARKRQYEVDDNALLELYLKIDKLHNMTDNIKLDDIKEIINQAIARSEKRASRRFFGGLKKKRSEQGDIIFLSEVDFKD